MPQSAESSTGEDLPLAISPSNEQLESINNYLNLILVALVSLANLDSESITQAAQELALDADTSDRLVAHYWQPQSKLSLADIRSLVMIMMTRTIKIIININLNNSTINSVSSITNFTSVSHFSI
ncbi:MAG: hypothetical protein ACKN87_06075, partial [Microcystis aeruginosa]